MRVSCGFLRHWLWTSKLQNSGECEGFRDVPAIGNRVGGMVLFGQVNGGGCMG